VILTLWEKTIMLSLTKMFFLCEKFQKNLFLKEEKKCKHAFCSTNLENYLNKLHKS